MVTCFLEMEFSGRGNGWTVVGDWLRAAGLTYHRGLPGTGITDLLADTGTLSFTLNNSRTNSAKVLGYYSPDNANCRAGFALDIGVRVRVTIGATDYIRFTGILDDINPVPGSHGVRTVECEALSWTDQATRIRLSNLPVLVNNTGDEVFQALIDSISPFAQPRAVEKSLSADTYPYTLDRTRDEQTNLYDELYRLALSGLDRIWERGDGTLVYEPRTVRALATQDSDTFTDHNGFSASRNRTDVVNKVQTKVHPRLPGTAASVLYKLDAPVAISPGNPVPLLGPWTDPANPDVRVGAVTLVSLVPTTDYQANSLANGSGTDLTGQLTIDVGLSGNATKFTVTLGGAQSGFITKLQQRGTPLLDYGETVAEWQDDDSIDQRGLLADTIDMPYQADPAFGLEVAQYYVYRRAQPQTEIVGFTRIVPLRDDAGVARSVVRDVSDRVALSDPVTGINQSFFINAIDEVIGDGWIQTVWTFVPADMTGYWLLEVVGRSELDFSTILGFGLIVGHTDVAHGDTHGDTAHGDAAHGDSHTDVAHGDTAHGDDATHGDVAHSDVAHSDVAHSDTEHIDTHTDTAHSDTAHVDSHGDVIHLDSHTDSHGDGTSSHGDGSFNVHVDVAHSDTAHSDTAHSDVAHEDTTLPHEDHTDLGFHDDHDDHTDTAHGDSAHSDTAHSDTAHSDHWHSDSHSDVAHSDRAHTDTHNDVAHSDAAHSDTHSDVAHVDVLHSDVSHSDVAAHDDSGHDDVAHSDSAHDDVPHSDVSHSDSEHVDTHSDTEHGDLN